MTAAPAPSFAHIDAMTDVRGTFEHADHTTPRREHGYCTDDMARLLVVAAREPNPDGTVLRLTHTAFRFLADSQGVDGKIRNRLDERGRWQDRRGVDDCWGRSLWAFGTAAAHAKQGWLRQSALTMFDHGTEQRSPWPRAMAFAALGAAEVAAVAPARRRALQLLDDASAIIGGAGPDAEWPWPEPRLTYANAVIPDAMIAIGSTLQRRDVLDAGLQLLEWLVARQMNGDHLSFVPADGAGPGNTVPRFDQQPIEAAALADACARAALVTGESKWAERVQLVVDWFLGDNDGGHVMFDPVTGGGFDGLTELGPNLNEGTESTLALVSTLQHARHLAFATP